MPGRHVTDNQMRLFMNYTGTHSIETAAARAGFSASTGHRIRRDPRLPSQKAKPRGSRRPDPLGGLFESEAVPLLEANPRLRPLAVFEEIETAVPEAPDVHLVMDNRATHKTERVRKWLARRRHWHVHFTPTSASRINQLERWFAELTRTMLHRGVHRSVAELNADIMSFFDARNEEPKPCRWVKSADKILV